MYAEPRWLLSLSQGIPQEPSPTAAARNHPPTPPATHDDFLRRFHSRLSCGADHLGNLVQNFTITEYDLGGEGDLFKAPEPIIEEPALELDPMAAAISMISVGENVVGAESIEVADLDSFEDGLLSEFFYECKKDILASSAICESISELSDVKVPVMQIEKKLNVKNNTLDDEGSAQKRVSSECLRSMNSCPMRPTFLNFQAMDLEAALGMRRAYSEGDMQTEDKTEERKEKLLRYREKKSKRNFGRKIKYACRKALADSQPRVRGRFAKTEESEIAK